jgi:uncharacterized protein YlzI (FlbEa/FlbD family)
MAAHVTIAMLAVFHAVEFTGADGQRIQINPQTVVSVREVHGNEDREGYFPSGVNCLIHTTDGKFVVVKEDCRTVVKRLKDEDTKP